MKYIYIFAGGKSVFFALAFFICGVILAFKHELTPVYVSMATAIQLLITTRSVMDDVHQRGMAKINGNGAKNGSTP